MHNVRTSHSPLKGLEVTFSLNFFVHNFFPGGGKGAVFFLQNPAKLESSINKKSQKMLHGKKFSFDWHVGFFIQPKKYLMLLVGLKQALALAKSQLNLYLHFAESMLRIATKRGLRVLSLCSRVTYSSDGNVLHCVLRVACHAKFL